MNSNIENNNVVNKTTKVTFLKRIEIATRDKKNYKNIWFAVLGMTLFIALLTGITLGLIFNEPSVIKDRVEAFKTYLLAAEILSFISLGIITFPYLYLSGSWIAGVNNTSKGPIYQIFLWTCYITSILFALIAFILYWTMWIAL